MENGQLVSPTEFERISGKAASKKWKASIRIDKVSSPNFPSKEAQQMEGENVRPGTRALNE